jgi:hypothetical protein
LGNFHLVQLEELNELRNVHLQLRLPNEIL